MAAKLPGQIRRILGFPWQSIKFCTGFVQRSTPAEIAGNMENLVARNCAGTMIGAGHRPTGIAANPPGGMAMTAVLQ